MLIDKILDRKADMENGFFRYDTKELYDYLIDSIHPSYHDVARAMDKGSNTEVQAEMCAYIDLEEYNPDIKWFVNSVDWLTSDPQKPKQELFQTIRAYKSREDMFAHNPLDLKFVVNQNPDYRERYEKEYAAGVAWGLTVKYAKPCVAVLTTIDGKTEVTEVHLARRCK